MGWGAGGAPLCSHLDPDKRLSFRWVGDLVLSGSLAETVSHQSHLKRKIGKEANYYIITIHSSAGVRKGVS